MSYAALDPVIDRWVQTHGLALSTAGGEARFWYSSSQSECFQVAVGPQTEAGVTVIAWAVETDDDAELRAQWTVAVENLEAALAAAADMIELWKRRTKTPELWKRT
jgi:hypothetical protein